MLQKIISIKNVGRFRNSATSGNPQLAKYTFILGANGYGKTTICAILRSLHTGEASHVLGRKTLGIADAATIELLLDSGQARFDGTSWSVKHPAISIFDGTFVAENIHSGEVVEIDHKRNLYRVIIGDDGVKLAEEETSLATDSRTKAAEISAAAKAIQPHVPTGMTFEAFLALPIAPAIDQQIVDQKQVVDAIRQASVVKDRALLSELTLPAIPEGFSDILSRTIDDISSDAESLLADHLAARGMTASGGNWIAQGIEHAADDICPFCGQDTRGLPLVAAFRAVFSERYKVLRSDIAAAKAQTIQAFGDAALARLDMVVEKNKSGIEFWGGYCTFDPALVVVPLGISAAARRLGEAALALLDRKAGAPLDAIAADEGFTRAITAYGAATADTNSVNDAIRAVNTLISAKKTEADKVNVTAAEAELMRRQAIKNRHTEPVATLCATHCGLVSAKAAIDKRKEAARDKLDAHTKGVVKPYEQRINDLLGDFNAGFIITETKHSYLGGSPTSSYQLVINEIAVDVGNDKTPTDQPSFKNTLSSGDRTTLALAFFLAHLERDHALTNKIAIFDDPFNSQDAFRRRQTIHEIVKVGVKCAQVVVLSHDATFLKQVWDKVSPAERVALAIVDHGSQGSKISPVDLEKACQGRTAIDMDDLQTYLSTGAGVHIDIIRKMRVVLETYCRATYSSCFLASDWLGDIVRKTREGGASHPAHALCDKLDQINAYTKQYHHGEDLTDLTPDLIDPTELKGFTKKTLKIVNALQA